MQGCATCLPSMPIFSLWGLIGGGRGGGGGGEGVRGEGGVGRGGDGLARSGVVFFASTAPIC
jgi:hypothetical protein